MESYILKRGSSWNELESPVTSWKDLEPAGTNYSSRNQIELPKISPRKSQLVSSEAATHNCQRSTIIEWNKLDYNIRNSSSFNIFRKSILKFIRPSGNSFFNCHNPKEIKFITRLRLGLSHLREHKFKHSFPDFLNPF